jgi:hypothetical protein
MTEPAHTADSHAEKRNIDEHVYIVAKKTRDFEAGMAEARARAQTLRAQYLARTSAGQTTSALFKAQESTPPQPSDLPEDPRSTSTPIADFQSHILELTALRRALQVAHHGPEQDREPRLRPTIPMIENAVGSEELARALRPHPESSSRDADQADSASVLRDPLMSPDLALPIHRTPPIPGCPRSQSALNDPDPAGPIPASSVELLNGESFVWPNGNNGHPQTEPAPEVTQSDLPPAQPPRRPRTTVVSRPSRPTVEGNGHNTEILPNLTYQHVDELADPGSGFLGAPATLQGDGHSDVADQAGWLSRIPSNLVIQLGAALVIVALVLIKFG